MTFTVHNALDMVNAINATKALDGIRIRLNVLVNVNRDNIGILQMQRVKTVCHIALRNMLIH